MCGLISQLQSFKQIKKMQLKKIKKNKYEKKKKKSQNISYTDHMDINIKFIQFNCFNKWSLNLVNLLTRIPAEKPSIGNTKQFYTVINYLTIMSVNTCPPKKIISRKKNLRIMSFIKQTIS